MAWAADLAQELPQKAGSPKNVGRANPILREMRDPQEAMLSRFRASCVALSTDELICVGCNVSRWQPQGSGNADVGHHHVQCVLGQAYSYRFSSLSAASAVAA